MEDAGDENSLFENNRKPAFENIFNGNIGGKITEVQIKINGDILKSFDDVGSKKDNSKEIQQESNAHIGNGDAYLPSEEIVCDKPEKDDKDVDLDSKVLNDKDSNDKQNIKDECKQNIKDECKQNIQDEVLNDIDKKGDIYETSKEEPTLVKSEETDNKQNLESKVEDAEEETDVDLVPEKNKFKLNDKIRNSLKGLQDKVKCSPDKHDVDLGNKADCKSPRTTTAENGHDGIEIGDAKEIATEIKDDSAVLPDSVKAIDSDKKDIVSKQVKDDEDVLLEDTQEGVPMEMGSEDEGNEDDLLDIRSENVLDKDTKCMEVNTSLSCLTEKVQFDEDSNSNSNSTSVAKVNAIVSFLDAEVSNTPSPMAVDNHEEEEAVSVNSESSKLDDSPLLKEETSLESSNSITNESKIDKNEFEEKECSEKLDIDVENKQLNEPVQTSIERTASPVNNSSKEEDEDEVIICENMTEVRKKTAAENKDASVDATESSTDTTESDKKHRKTSEEDEDVIFEKEVKSSEVTFDKKPNCDIKQTDKEPDEITSQDSATKNKDKLETQKSEDDDVLNNDIKTVEKDHEELQQNDKKRSLENDSEMDESNSKRTKLDLSGLIGKLGSRVQPVELTDSEEEEESEDTETASQITEKESMDSETEIKNDKCEKEKSNSRFITEKELQQIVQKKVKEYLTSQRDTLLVQLSQKVKELQLSNDLWKKQVKDLQVKVNDVTVLQQKLEERKAKTDALRQITKRSVGLQVDDGRTSSSQSNPALRERLAASISTTPSKSTPSSQSRTMTVTKSPVNKTPEVMPSTKVLHAPAPVVTALPGSNGTIRLPIPQSSQPLLNQHFTPGQMSVAYKPPSVKSLLDTTRKQPTISSTPVTPATTTPTSVINLVQLPRLMTPSPTSQGYVAVSQVANPVTKVVSKPSTGGGVTTIDLTDDEESAKTRLLTIPANAINTPTGVQVLPPGTQLIRAPGPNSQYQLVFSSTSPALRPTVMPAAISTVQQPGTTLLKTLPQTNVVTLTSPGVLAPGATMTRVGTPIIQIPTGTLPQPVPPKVTTKPTSLVHPAPFPALPVTGDPTAKLPPKPILKISRVSQGIVLSWNMNNGDSQTDISSYQLFAYQETAAPPSTNLWKKVGDVKALPLPMACTLTQFQVGNKYHFAVRSMDNKSRVGHFSDPSSIYLTPVSTTAT